MDKGFYNYCSIFGTCGIRLLNQTLNLGRIFDCFSHTFGKVVFNLRLSNLVDSDPHLKAVTSGIKIGTCKIRSLNWVTITVSSITKNTGRYTMIHTAFFIFL